MERENEMDLISRIAVETDVPVDTIRRWARDKQIEAELRDTMVGKAWFTTIKAVKERAAKRGPGGRPRKK